MYDKHYTKFIQIITILLVSQGSNTVLYAKIVHVELRELFEYTFNTVYRCVFY